LCDPLVKQPRVEILAERRVRENHRLMCVARRCKKDNY
jgi:hypothetical protein